MLVGRGWYRNNNQHYNVCHHIRVVWACGVGYHQLTCQVSHASGASNCVSIPNSGTGNTNCRQSATESLSIICQPDNMLRFALHLADSRIIQFRFSGRGCALSQPSSRCRRLLSGNTIIYLIGSYATDPVGMWLRRVKTDTRAVHNSKCRRFVGCRLSFLDCAVPHIIRLY